MFAVFQSVGSMPVVSDVLNMIGNLFRTRGWRPSGPGDLNVFCFFSFNATIDGLIVQKSIVLEHLFGSSGMSPSASLVNTEEKYQVRLCQVIFVDFVFLSSWVFPFLS